MRRRELFQASDYCEESKYSGPVMCKSEFAWLGNGYYFWDDCEPDAHWWGNTHYNGNYIISKSAYDFHSEYFFDIVSFREDKEYLLSAYEMLKERSEKLNRKEVFTVGRIIEILKRTDKSFSKYLAIRACPIPNELGKKLYFDTKCRYYVLPLNKFQLCVINKSFLIEVPYLYYSSPIVSGEI